MEWKFYGILGLSMAVTFLMAYAMGMYDKPSTGLKTGILSGVAFAFGTWAHYVSQ